MQIDRHHDAKPDRVNPLHRQQDRGNQRNHDKRDFNEVEEKPEEEHHQHDHDDGCCLTTRKVAQEFMHGVVTTKTTEHQ